MSEIEIRLWRPSRDDSEMTEELARVRKALIDAIELAEEGWDYASPYFREKWGYEERIKAIREVVDE